MAYINSGYQGWKILEQRYSDDTSLTGLIMPNISQISASCIVPSSATITYNYPADVAPTGGVDGDVWYNPVANQLFKKESGTWVLKTDRVDNDAYVSPVINLTDCPLP